MDYSELKYNIKAQKNEAYIAAFDYVSKQILANKDKVTMVHEFYVRDCMFDSVISRLQQQYERLMSDFKKINIYGPGMGFIDWRVE